MKISSRPRQQGCLREVRLRPSHLFWQRRPLLFFMVRLHLIMGYFLLQLAALSMSIFVFAGVSQFVAVTLMGTSAPVLIIILTVFVVNLRHVL